MHLPEEVRTVGGERPAELIAAIANAAWGISRAWIQHPTRMVAPRALRKRGQHMGPDTGRSTNHWNISELQHAPDYEMFSGDSAIREILYLNEPYRGRPTRVFAYMGVPRTAGQTVPGMVCVHGGLGRAFKQWVALWNARGYAAIAMDLNGCGPDGERLADGGPALEDAEIFVDPSTAWREHWTYHAIAGIMRAHSILRAQPHVDAARIGITGISWGGYLTCIISGVDHRFACAIPVYGCGFLQHNSRWHDALAAMAEAARCHWHDLCDPSVYLGHAALPMLFINGTNDIGYPLDSYKLTYSLVRGPLILSVRPDMPHGHEEGWAPREISIFTDHLFRGTPALPRIGAPVRSGGQVSAPVSAERRLVDGVLIHTADRGPWQARSWHLAPAQLHEGRVSAALPEEVSAYYLAVTDEAGAYVSCAHEDVQGIP